MVSKVHWQMTLWAIYCSLCVYLVAHCRKLSKVNIFLYTYLWNVLSVWWPVIASCYITVSVLYGNLENTHQGTVPRHTPCIWLELFLLFLMQNNCEYSLEDGNGQWPPKFTSSCITYFCETQGLPTGCCGRGRLPALSSSCTRLSWKSLSVIFVPYAVKRRKLFRAVKHKK